MTYRFLEDHEWDRAKTFGNFPRPKPEYSKIVIAETEDGQVAGYWVLQMALHLEPLFIEDRYRGKVRVDRLYEKMMESVAKGSSIYCLADEGSIAERIAKFFGAKKLHHRIWVKEIK